MLVRHGEQGENVKSIQEILTHLGYRLGPIDGIYGDKTESAVVQFQEEHNLYADGIVGPNTWNALHWAHTIIVDEQTHPLTDPGTHPELMQWVRVAADKYGEGFDRFFLREDAATAYMRVRERVIEAGGILTSSGARRDLDAPVGASRSATSFHYTGRALDLFIWSGMVNRERDPFVVTPDGDRYWRVFVRADGGEQVELNAVTYGLRKVGKPVSGKFLDLTALFEKEGFIRIRARPSFFSGGSRLGAEWWHFQYVKGLETGITTFGDELLKVYSEEQLIETPPWRFRSRVYGVNWF